MSCTSSVFSNYNVFHSLAIKDASRGRAKAGIIVALNREYYTSQLLYSAPEYLIIKVNLQSFLFILCVVYISPNVDVESFLNDFSVTFDLLRMSFANVPVFVGGDFNCRVANFNNLDKYMFNDNDFFSSERMSLDLFIDKRGKLLVDFMESNELFVCNGRSISDTPAQFTFKGSTGKSINDLVWCSFTGLDNLKDFKVLNLHTLSDYFPVSLYLCNLDLVSQNDSEETAVNKFIFDKSLSQEFTDLLRWKNEVALVSDDIDKMNSNIITAIKNVATELKMEKSYVNSSKIIVKNKLWFDKECREAKKSY